MRGPFKLNSEAHRRKVINIRLKPRKEIFSKVIHHNYWCPAKVEHSVPWWKQIFRTRFSDTCIAVKVRSEICKRRLRRPLWTKFRNGKNSTLTTLQSYKRCPHVSLNKVPCVPRFQGLLKVFK